MISAALRPAPCRVGRVDLAHVSGRSPGPHSDVLVVPSAPLVAQPDPASEVPNESAHSDRDRNAESDHQTHDKPCMLLVRVLLRLGAVGRLLRDFGARFGRRDEPDTVDVGRACSFDHHGRVSPLASSTENVNR